MIEFSRCLGHIFMLLQDDCITLHTPVNACSNVSIESENAIYCKINSSGSYLGSYRPNCLFITRRLAFLLRCCRPAFDILDVKSENTSRVSLLFAGILGVSALNLIRIN